MMVNNLSALQGQKQQFYSVGDVAGTLEKDNEIAETELIIAKLRRTE